MALCQYGAEDSLGALEREGTFYKANGVREVLTGDLTLELKFGGIDQMDGFEDSVRQTTR